MRAFILFTSCALIIVGLARCTDTANEGTLSSEEKKAYLEKGSQIAQETFAALSGQLSEAMAEKGVAGAVEYCSLAALPIVDSLSSVHQAEIRRTSLNVRNPADSPTRWELDILRDYEEASQEGKELRPVVKELGEEKVAFAAPIYVKPLCLKCHGQVGQELDPEALNVIRELYPDDEAISYREGDLRGIWSITFNR